MGRYGQPGFQAEQTARVEPRRQEHTWLLVFQAHKEVCCDLSKEQKRGSKDHTGMQEQVTKDLGDRDNGFSFCSNLNTNW